MDFCFYFGVIAEIGHRLFFFNLVFQITHNSTPTTDRTLWRSVQPFVDAATYTTSTMTKLHALSGIQTRNPSNRAAADLHLRPHGIQDWLILDLPNLNLPYQSRYTSWLYYSCDLFSA